jgi:hypothetical protein
MAGKITHIESLSQAIKLLEHGSADQKKLARLLDSPHTRNYSYFGSIAPDLFYFYHVLSSRKNKKSRDWGDLFHHHNATELALNMLDLAIEEKQLVTRERLFSFIMGYICHSVVDVITHPYIFYISGDYYNADLKISSEAQLNHLKTEFQLDAYLIYHRWGIRPEEYDFLQYVELNENQIPLFLWKFWQDSIEKTYTNYFHGNYIGSKIKIIPGDLLNDSYQGYLEFHQKIDSRNGYLRTFLNLLDKISMSRVQSSVLVLPLVEELNPKIMNLEKHEWSYPADPNKKKNSSYIDLVHEASHKSKEILTEAYDYISKPNPELKKSILDKYSGFNLDTGLKNIGHEMMTNFSPVVKS